MTPKIADVGTVFRLLIKLDADAYFDIFENRGLFGDDPSASSLVLVRRDVPWVRAPLTDLWALPAVIDDSFARHPKGAADTKENKDDNG